MRRNVRSIERLLGSIPVLFFASGAWANEPGAAAWNDQHMRSNFAARAHASPARPPIQIGEPNSGDAQVSEQLLSISPHGWEPGVSSFGSAQPGASARSFSSTSSVYPTRATSARGSSRSHGRRARASR